MRIFGYGHWSDREGVTESLGLDSPFIGDVSR